MSGHVMKGGLFAAAALCLGIAMPAQAMMGCWNPTQVAAAKVRDLQSRLMVATLRCQAMGGADVTGAYNRFVHANMTTLQGANQVLLSQFRSGFGEAGGQTEYDHFATALANGYGGDATDPTICAATAALADEAAGAAGDIAQLVAIEDRVGATPSLPGGECGLSLASASAN